MRFHLSWELRGRILSHALSLHAGSCKQVADNLALCACAACIAGCVTTASAKPEFVCNLGANVTWAKGDSVRVTVPIVAALNATGNLTNVASVVDLKNNTAGDSKTTQICTKCLPPTVRETKAAISAA